jgi:dihydroxyacid dehydratase/phosphogluconate dehydratase
LSVTAPSEAEFTNLAYLASTPRVYFGAGCCHLAKRAEISVSSTWSVSFLVSALMVILSPFSHLVILYGNLAAQGSVAKITGKEGLHFTGTAKVFDAEEQALQGILNGDIVKGDVIVIRYEGPKGGPGMREMLSPTSAIMGKGLGKDVAQRPNYRIR